MEYSDHLENQQQAGTCSACGQDMDSGRCDCTEEQQDQGPQGCTCGPLAEHCTC